jgi:hypothetical protein
MTREEATTLSALRVLWQGRYQIDVTDGVWTAYRVSDALVTFSADGGEELRFKISEDYTRWQQAARRHNS